MLLSAFERGYFCPAIFHVVFRVVTLSAFPLTGGAVSSAIDDDYGDPMDICDTPISTQHNASDAQYYDDPMDICNTPTSDPRLQLQSSEPYRPVLLQALNRRRNQNYQQVLTGSPEFRGHTTIFERRNEPPQPESGPMAIRIGPAPGAQNHHSRGQNQNLLSQNAPRWSQNLGHNQNQSFLNRLVNHSSSNSQTLRQPHYKPMDIDNDPEEHLISVFDQRSRRMRSEDKTVQVLNNRRFGKLRAHPLMNIRLRKYLLAQNPPPSTIPRKRTLVVADSEEQPSSAHHQSPYPPTVYPPSITLRDSWPEQGWGAVHESAEEGRRTGIDPFKETVHPYIPGAWPETPDGSDIDMEDAVPSTEFEVPLMSGALPATPTKPPREFVPISPRMSTIPGAYPSDGTMFTQEEATQVPSSLGDPNAESGEPSSWIAWADTIRRVSYAHRTVLTVVRAAVRIAGSFKRQAVALCQRRERYTPPRRRTTPPRRVRGLNRGRSRPLTEEERRRIKSEQWRRDRGYETIQHISLPDFGIIIDRYQEQRLQEQRLQEQRLQEQLLHEHHLQEQRFQEQRLQEQRLQEQLLQEQRFQEQRLQEQGPTEIEPMPMDYELHQSLPNVDIDQLQGDTGVEPRVSELAPTDTTPEPRIKKPSPNRYQPYYRPNHISSRRRLFGHAVHNIQRQPLTERQPPAPPANLNDPNFLTFGRAVSAVNLVRPIPLTIPPGRTESILTEEWRRIENERIEKEKSEEKPKMRVRIEGPAVQPLTPEWEAKVCAAMRKRDNDSVATTLSGEKLSRKDLATCCVPEAWLNDNVITAYLSLLVDHLRRTNNNAGRHDKPRFHAFNTFFFSNLRDKGYPHVSRWARRAKIGGPDLLNVETVFVPVHNRAHWTLIVVKPTERTIENFDSLGSLSQVHVNLIKGWLAGELGNEFVAEEWKVLSSASPQQTNGSDCGVFLLSTAKAVALGIDPLSYGPGDIPQLRRKVVGELMNGGLEGAFNPLEGKL